VAAGGPAPQAKLLKRRAVKRAPNEFPFIQSPFLNQRSLFRNGVTPSKYELSWEQKQKQKLPLPLLHDTLEKRHQKKVENYARIFVLNKQ
jgi:hypothetical protein